MAEASKRRKLDQGGYKAVDSKPNDTSTNEPAVEKKDQRRSLFVRSLPASVTTERLTAYFSQSYPLKHATVVVDPQTKISRGFGFVTFADVDDAQAAAAEFNNSVLDGRKIKVEVAESRHRETVQDGGRGGPNTKAVELRAQREKQRTETQPPRLIVRNLPWSVKEPEDLAVLFQSYGKVKQAIVPKRSPKVQAGFGIVILRGLKNAERAIAGLNGKEVDGRHIAVDWAADKKTWEEMQKGQKGEEKSGQTEDSQPENGVNVVGDGVSEHLDNGDPEDSDLLHEDETIAELDRNDAEDEDEDEDEASEDDEDVENEHDDEHGDEDEDEEKREDTSSKTTVFVRNLPFTTDDDSLKAHFSRFGPLRYARVVLDPETERSRGTAFVCFFNEDDAKSCVKNAPKHQLPSAPSTTDKKRRGETLTHSILQNEATDPSGQYTLEGRVLQVTRALSRSDAAKRAEEASSTRDVRDRDKRRLYLLSEGTVSKGSKLYDQLGKADIDVRESSAKQRQKLIKTNPNLCLSLTRLSVRNIPRSIGSKDLKALAREAVVGFATDVKNGVRQPLSKEEVARDRQAMKDAERQRKLKGVGIVKQAKIVFEGREGEKIKDDAGGAGRSRGYGFIEYVSHRNALMGLRWLNGHYVKSEAKGDRGKRLIVEFAIENAQVVQRRNEREVRERTERSKAGEGGPVAKSGRYGRPVAAKLANGKLDEKANSKKRKRDEKLPSKPAQEKATPAPLVGEEKNRVAKRNRIIAKKRQARQTRTSK